MHKNDIILTDRDIKSQEGGCISLPDISIGIHYWISRSGYIISQLEHHKVRCANVYIKSGVCIRSVPVV